MLCPSVAEAVDDLKAALAARDGPRARASLEVIRAALGRLFEPPPPRVDPAAVYGLEDWTCRSPNSPPTSPG